MKSTQDTDIVMIFRFEQKWGGWKWYLNCDGIARWDQIEIIFPVSTVLDSIGGGGKLLKQSV